MKIRSALSLSLVFASGLAVGCGGHTRTPAEWTEDTRALLEGQSEFIKACYTKELKENPKLEGTVTVKFTVENDTGRVRRVKIDDAGTTAGDPVRKCVMENIKDLRLKPPDANDGLGTFTWQFTATVPPAQPEEATPADAAAAPPAS